ncbi:hypothetical protein [Bifidobacterium thermophilum]|uniref:hypothetical protein n=1 Tax=Bifidobacterium thermophilum TaxID=33905 RepID=UPI003F925F83
MASHKRNKGDSEKQGYSIGDFLVDNGRVIGYLLTAVFITLLAVSLVGDIIKLFA